MHGRLRRTAIPIVAILTCWAAAPSALPQPSSLFAFTTDNFWLDLHHYLYVLGRAHNGAPDATQPSVASALDDEKQGLADVTDEERRSWKAAVAAYASGLSRRSNVFQLPLSKMTIDLAKTGDVPAFRLPSFDPAAREAMERAAPVFRKAWWERHRTMNERYIAALRAQLESDGPAIVQSLTRIYQLPWPDRPYPTHVVAYANWQGAFSFTGELMVLSSNANPVNDRWFPLESVFHEAMHQWDDRVQDALRAQAAPQNLTVAQDLSHALLFYTVGYVVRQRHPEHEPLMDAANIWRGMLSGARAPVVRLRPALLETWTPYIEGRGTRDEAFAAMVAAAVIPPPPAK